MDTCDRIFLIGLFMHTVMDRQVFDRLRHPTRKETRMPPAKPDLPAARPTQNAAMHHFGLRKTESGRKTKHLALLSSARCHCPPAGPVSKL